MKRVLHTCCAVHLHDDAAPIGTLRAWGTSDKFWPQQANLRVRFMGGSTSQRNAAWKRFRMVDALVNLHFRLAGPTENAEIRVRFNRNAGHWSFIGTDCRRIPQRSQTMNLALSTGAFGDDDAEWDRVAIHEVLHSVGLNHEHQHPRAEIQWNVPKVLEYYRRTQGWSDDEIRFQVINREPLTNTFTGTRFDRDSIMEYAVPKELTLNGVEIGWNRKLSPLDISFLKQIYP